MRLRGSIAVLAGALLIPGAMAQTLGVSGTVVGGGDSQSTSSNPGSASLSDGSYISGSATKTTLGASSYAVANGDDANMTSSRSVTDWTLSGPSASTTNGALNLILKGTMSADYWNGYARVGLDVDVVDMITNTTVFDDGITFGYAGASTGNANFGSVEDQELNGDTQFSSFVNAAQADPTATVLSLSSGLMFSTDPIEWTAGDTYQVQTYLSTTAYFDDEYTLSSTPDSALFSDPFSFYAPDVVDLPNGWTLNSPQSGIVNNVLTPEPAPLVALGLGVVGLLVRRRRIRSS